jgi:hypothetical protein
MNEKKFRLSEGQIKALIKPIGSCYATDPITLDGLLVGYMYREDPDFAEDSGWRFFPGEENQEYVDNPDNTMIYDVNTIANYDPAIIPYLHLEIGAELERQEDNTFKTVEE